MSQWALSTTAGNDLVTVTIRAKIEASSQFRDGEVREDEKVAVSYSQTTVRRIVPLNSSSCDIKEVSHTP